MVKSILRLILQAYRLSKECRANNIISEYERAGGGMMQQLHPAVKMSKECEKEIIVGLEKLDRMFFGEKHVNENLNINTEPIPASELYKKRVNT